MPKVVIEMGATYVVDKYKVVRCSVTLEESYDGEGLKANEIVLLRNEVFESLRKDVQAKLYHSLVKQAVEYIEFDAIPN